MRTKNIPTKLKIAGVACFLGQTNKQLLSASWHSSMTLIQILQKNVGMGSVIIKDRKYRLHYSEVRAMQCTNTSWNEVK